MIWLLLSLSVSVVAQSNQLPFYSSNHNEPLFNKIQISEYQGPNDDANPDVDARQIIAPFMTPFMDMFDAMQKNARAKAYAEKITREREESPLTNSRSIFDIIEKLQRPTTTTTPQPPLIERLLKPYIEPWQRQLDDFSKDMAGITFIPTSTTTTPSTTTAQSLLEKSLGIFFPSLRKSGQETKPSTTKIPRLFDPDMLEKLLFSRDKRENRQKRQSIYTSTPLTGLSSWEKPTLDLSDPFTPNPIMALFTTPKALDITISNEPKSKPIHDFSSFPILQPTFKIQDPFYNPLFPNRKSKLFDILAGGEATRILG